MKGSSAIAAIDPASLGVATPATMPGHERALPVGEALQPLLVEGLRAGTITTVAAGPARTASGTTTLALALAAEASAAGATTAIVGFPALNPGLVAELGFALDRVVLVTPATGGRLPTRVTPGAGGSASPWPTRSSGEPRVGRHLDPTRVWSTVVATLISAFDIVLLDGRHRAGSVDARRLLARSREHGTALIQLGSAWPDRPDLSLTVTQAAWEGLGRGHGHLRRRRAIVEATGRRGAASVRRAALWLPDADGTVTSAPPLPVELVAGRGSRRAAR